MLTGCCEQHIEIEDVMMYPEARGSARLLEKMKFFP